MKTVQITKKYHIDLGFYWLMTMKDGDGLGVTSADTFYQVWEFLINDLKFF